MSGCNRKCSVTDRCTSCLPLHGTTARWNQNKCNKYVEHPEMLMRQNVVVVWLQCLLVDIVCDTDTSCLPLHGTTAGRKQNKCHMSILVTVSIQCYTCECRHCWSLQVCWATTWLSWMTWFSIQTWELKCSSRFVRLATLSCSVCLWSKVSYVSLESLLLSLSVHRELLLPHFDDFSHSQIR